MRKLMMIVMIFMSFISVAQKERHSKEFMNDLSADEIATLKTKKMTLHLDLNESQQAKVKTLLLKEAEHKEKQKTKFKKTKDGEKPSKEERLAVMNDRLDRQIEMKKQMKSILTEAQYEKWNRHLTKKEQQKRKNKHPSKSDR